MERGRGQGAAMDAREPTLPETRCGEEAGVESGKPWDVLPQGLLAPCRYLPGMESRCRREPAALARPCKQERSVPAVQRGGGWPGAASPACRCAASGAAGAPSAPGGLVQAVGATAWVGMPSSVAWQKEGSRLGRLRRDTHPVTVSSAARTPEGRAGHCPGDGDAAKLKAMPGLAGGQPGLGDPAASLVAQGGGWLGEGEGQAAPTAACTLPAAPVWPAPGPGAAGSAVGWTAEQSPRPDGHGGPRVGRPARGWCGLVVVGQETWGAGWCLQRWKHVLGQWEQAGCQPWTSSMW